jgi:hypothetical protein
MVLMKNVFLLPLEKIRDYIERTIGVKLSVSYVDKTLKNFASYMRPNFFKALDKVNEEKILNIDETVWKCAGKQLYAWFFLGSKVALFKIGTREASNLRSVLGEDYEGTIVSDCYCVYISYAKNHDGVHLQLCLAHLSRDFKRCSDFILNTKVSEFGQKGEQCVKDIFKLHKQYKEESYNDSPEALKTLDKLKALEKELIELGINAPTSFNKSKGIGKRFKEHPSYYFVFLDNPDVEPSNNRAERGLRTLVLERKISYLVQGITGLRTCETFWTIRETAKLLGRNLEEYYLF